MSLYVNDNFVVINECRRLLGLPGSVFDYVIDRKARTIKSDITGETWTIPAEVETL